MAVAAQSRPHRPRSRPARLIRSPPAPGYVRAHWPRHGCTPAPGVCLARLRSASPSFAPRSSNRLHLLPLGRARARPGSVVPGIRLSRSWLYAGCVFRLTRAAPRLLVRRGGQAADRRAPRSSRGDPYPKALCDSPAVWRRLASRRAREQLSKARDPGPKLTPSATRARPASRRRRR